MQESELEQIVIDLFQEQGYLFSKGSEIRRDNHSEVFLMDDLTHFLRSQNPRLNDHDALMIAIDIQQEEKNLFDFNKSFFRKLTDGLSYKREHTEELFSVRLINFFDPDKNIFRIVNQLSVQGRSTHRADIVIYINGIPFVVWELKSPKNENVNLRDAYLQIQTYRNEISELFKYNAFTVICDGSNTKYGVAHSKFKDFYEWKEKNKVVPENNRLNDTIKGLFSKERIISIIKDFICFSDNNSREKIICRYHQFFAAIKILKSIEKNLKPHGTGKGGVYFGSAGCGKSCIMLFLSKLLINSKILNRPSILLITDRNELNDQLTTLFKKHSEFLGDRNIKKIDSRKELKECFEKLTSGGIFLTNIQKFSEDNEELSKRNNIICLSDEAHRSQHNFDSYSRPKGEEITSSVPFAKRLHDSLPNATYFGFTATPKDETMDVFGNIVDQYSMRESQADNFTVQINFEWKHAEMESSEEILKEIDLEYDKYLREGVPEHQINKNKKEQLKLRTLISNPKRISKVTEDIIWHYEKRIEEGSTVKGKAIIVTSSRDIGFEIYKKIKELRPDWCETKNNKEEPNNTKPVAKVNMVMTRHGKEGELYKLLGDEEKQKELARLFKNPDSNFKIAIVKDKWLTGFDVPCLDTMYLDKMVYDANLIQTISRVNRQFTQKESGLVVNYLPIKKFVQEAIRKFGGGEDLNREFGEVENIVDSTKNKLELLNKLFVDFDKSAYFSTEGKEKLNCIWKAVYHIDSKLPKFSKDFDEKFRAFRSDYKKCASSNLISQEIRNEHEFYGTLWSVWGKRIREEAADNYEVVGKNIKKLIEEAFLLDDCKVILRGQIKVESLSIADLEKIKAIKDVNVKIKQYFWICKKINGQFTKINSKKSLKFSEELEKLKKRYNDLGVENEDKEISDIRDKTIALIEDYINENEFYKSLGLNRHEKIIYDILNDVKDEFKFEYPKDKIIILSKEINNLLLSVKKYADWYKRENTKQGIKKEITLLMGKYDYPKNYQQETREKLVGSILYWKNSFNDEWN